MKAKSVLSVPFETGVIINQAIARMYHHAHSNSVVHFKEKVLEQLNEATAFDSACWLSFGGTTLPLEQQCAFLFHLPEHFLPDYFTLLENALVEQLNKSGVELNGGLGCSVDLVRDVTSTSHLKKFGIHHQHLLVKEFAGKRHILCLYRTHESHEFDQYDIEITDFMVENLIRAYDLHLQCKLNRAWEYKNSYKAICDMQGLVLTAEPGFEACLQKVMPNWHSSYLSELLHKHNLPAKLEFGEFKLQLTRDGELCKLEIYKFDEFIEKLTRTEIDVAKLLTEGLTAAQVAANKGVSRRTIDNQIMSIHHKLGISKNTELISSLLHSNYNFSL